MSSWRQLKLFSDRLLEQRQGLKIACIEEIAYSQGYIDDIQLRHLAEAMAKSSYGRYLLEILNDRAHPATVQSGDRIAVGSL